MIFIFNRTSNSSNSELNEKYFNIKKTVIEMMSPFMTSRPNCEKLLKEKSLWFLEKNIIKYQFKNFNEKTIEESFSEYFVKNKHDFNNY